MLEKQLRDVVWKGLSLLGEGREFYDAITTPDIDMLVRLYKTSSSSLHASPMHIVGYHWYGVRECITVVSVEDTVEYKSFILSLLLSIAGSSYCGAWASLPERLATSASTATSILSSLGKTVVPVKPGCTYLWKRVLPHAAIIDELELYTASTKTLKTLLEEMGLSLESEKIAVYEPRERSIQQLLELISTLSNGIQLEFIVEDGKPYRAKTPIQIGELLEILSQGYSIVELDVERTAREKLLKETSIALLPPSISLDLDEKTLAITPPWTPPINHTGNISWLVYGVGWIHRLLDTIGEKLELDKTLRDILDLWKYQLREKKASLSDAALVIGLKRLLEIMYSLFQESC